MEIGRALYLSWARRPRPSGLGMTGPSPAGEQRWWYTLLSSSAPVQLHAVSAVPQSIVPAGTSSTVVEQVRSERGVCEERPLHWMNPHERCGTTHQRQSRSPRLEPWGVVTVPMWNRIRKIRASASVTRFISPNSKLTLLGVVGWRYPHGAEVSRRDARA